MIQISQFASDLTAFNSNEEMFEVDNKELMSRVFLLKEFSLNSHGICYLCDFVSFQGIIHKDFTHHSTEWSSCTACMKALTLTVSGPAALQAAQDAPAMNSFALLYIVLNFPILQLKPMRSKRVLISSLERGSWKSYSEMPSSVNVDGNSRSTASGSSPQFYQRLIASQVTYIVVCN